MRDTRGNPMRRCAPVALLAAAVLAGTSGLQGQVAGGGAYLAVGVGFAQGAATESTLTGTNSPTRCDRLLYPNPADAPTDAGCTEGTLDGLYLFDPERGLTGSFAVGYTFGALSVEIEALQRHQIIHNTLFMVGDLAGSAITGKDTEWSPARPPWADISEFRGRQVFANLYYSLPNQSRLTPYVGVGAGLSRVDFRYYLGFNRKSIDEGYLEAFGGSRDDPGASPDWQRAAAGTASELSTDVTGRGLGMQVLGGVDFAFSPQTSLGLRGRWVRVPNVSQDDTWTTMRSHAPVHADGVTPFVSTNSFSKLGYWSVTAILKYSL